MKNILRLEEFAMFAICVYALFLLKAEWWCYLLLLAGPDISMIGYLAGNKTGAATYNLFHHKGLATGIYVTGLLLNNDPLKIAGIVLFGHASMDRMFGFGLKFPEGFKHTHLGMIEGRKK